MPEERKIRERIRSGLKKAAAVTTAVMMTAASIGAASVAPVSAASATVHFGGYAQWPSGGSKTGRFSINGQPALCYQHANASPKYSKTATYAGEYNSAAIRKILYYGFNGPDTSYWGSKAASVSDKARVLTTRALSMAASGNVPDHHYRNDSKTDRYARAYYYWATARPDPKEGWIVFSNTAPSVHLDTQKNVQVSDTVTARKYGSRNDTLSGTVDTGNENVIIVNETSGKSGRRVKITQWDKFHLQAAAGYTGSISLTNLDVGGGGTYTAQNWTTSRRLQNLTYLTFSYKSNATSLMASFVGTAQVSASKKDITGTSEVKGAKMRITDAAGHTVSEWVSDGSDHVVRGLVRGSRYTLTEMQAPGGYEKAEAIQFTAGQTDHVTMKDARKKTSITIKKTGADNPTQPAPGNAYRITGITTDGQKVTDERTTDGNGLVTFVLEAGNYEMRESRPASGYYKDPTLYKISVADDMTVTINGKITRSAEYFGVKDKERWTAEIVLEKKDIATLAPIAGATYRLAGTSDAKTPVEMYSTSDSNGTIRFSDVETGTYDLTETVAPHGYHRLSRTLKVRVTHTAGQKKATATVTDPDKTAADEEAVSGVTLYDTGLYSFRIRKKSDTDGSVLKGAKFVLTGTSSFGTTLSGDAVKSGKKTITGITAVTNANGYATFSDIEPGTYQLYEYESPKGYSLDASAHWVSISYTGKVTSDLKGQGEGAQLFLEFSDSLSTAKIPVRKKWVDKDASKRKLPVLHLDSVPTYATWRENYHDMLDNTLSAFYYVEYGISSKITAVKYENIPQEKVPASAVRMDENYGDDNAKYKIYCWITEDNVMHYWTNAQTTAMTDSSNKLFGGLESAKSIDLSHIDTGRVTAMKGMFSNCSQLEEIDLSRLDTSNATSMANMFLGCQSLKTVDATQLNTSKVTNMESMFSGCSGLTSLDLSSFDTSKVTNMESMFDGCSGLTSLDLSSFDTSNVTDMGSMFSGCFGLTSLDLSSFDTSNVTDTGGMFQYCKSLTSLDVSSFNTSQVTDMRYMFEDCKSLTSLDLSLFDTSKATSMSHMFHGCSGLTSLNVSGFRTSNVTDMSGMFYDCSKLTSLDVSHFNTSNVRNMGGSDDFLFPDKGMFEECSSLTSLDVSHFDTSKVMNMCRMFYNCSGLTSLNVSGFRTPNVTNMSGMFYRCSKLTSLDVSRFDTSKVTDMGANDGYLAYKAGMFEECSSLTSLDVSHFDTSKVTNMSHMFYDCSELTSLNVSGFRTQNVTNMVGMFYNCSKLTSLDVSHFDTSNTEDVGGTDNFLLRNKGMFENCSSLTSLDVSHFNTSKVTNMHKMFYGCSGLTSLNVSGFRTSSVTDMGGMFYDCSKLTSLDVSHFDTSNVKDMSGIDNLWDSVGMFQNCSSLTSLDLSSFDTSKVTGMNSMFSGCSGLTSLDLSSFDTSKVTGMNSMFSGCSGLKNIYVSDSWNIEKVTSSGSMFYNCSKLPNYSSSSEDKTHANYGNGGYLTYKAHTAPKTNLILALPDMPDIGEMSSKAISFSKAAINNVKDITLIRLQEIKSNVSAILARSVDSAISRLNSISLLKGVNAADNQQQTSIGEKHVTTEGVSWQKVADEGGTFTLPQDADIIYGTDTAYVSKHLKAGTYKANAAGLGVSQPASSGTREVLAKLPNWIDRSLPAGQTGTMTVGGSTYVTHDASWADTKSARHFDTDKYGNIPGYWEKINDSTYQYTFSVYDKDVDWNVYEEKVDGYTGDHLKANPYVLANGSSEIPEITNSQEGKYGAFSVKKITQTSAGKDLQTDDTFSFIATLTDENGNAIRDTKGAVTYGDATFSNGVARFTLKKNETKKFTNIPAGWHYRVEETRNAKYPTTLVNGTKGYVASGTVTAGGQASVTYTNRITPPYDSLLYTAQVTKKLADGTKDDGGKYRFHVHFRNLEIKDAENVPIANNAAIAIGADNTADVIFDLKAGQKMNFANLNEGAEMTVTEEGGSYVSSYVITKNGTKTESGEQNETERQLSTGYVKVAENGNASNPQVTFTNRPVSYQSLTVEKKEDGGDANRSFSMTAEFSGLKTSDRIATGSDSLIPDNAGKIVYRFALKPGEKREFSHIPAGAQYRVTESAEERYAPSYKVTASSGGTVAKAADSAGVQKPLSTALERLETGSNDTVTFTNAYSYSFGIRKRNQDNDALSGAEFILRKVTVNADRSTSVDAGTKAVTDAHGFAGWRNLKAGMYVLSETKTPAGYSVAPSRIIRIDNDGTAYEMTQLGKSASLQNAEKALADATQNADDADRALQELKGTLAAAQRHAELVKKAADAKKKGSADVAQLLKDLVNASSDADTTDYENATADQLEQMAADAQNSIATIQQEIADRTASLSAANTARDSAQKSYDAVKKEEDTKGAEAMTVNDIAKGVISGNVMAEWTPVGKTTVDGISYTQFDIENARMQKLPATGAIRKAATVFAVTALVAAAALAVLGATERRREKRK